MQYGQIPGIDKPISRVVQGTMKVGSRNLDEGFALLDSALELGCNTLDTAHGYGQAGDSERSVGRWINERGVRDQVVILGKGAHHNQDRKRVTPYDITADLHDSLARFKVDYIDLYLLHRDDPDVPVGPIVDILNEHHAAGKILAFGGSNWSHDRITEANDYARQHGLVPFVASSPNFSLAEQLQEPWPGCVSIGGQAGQAARAWYGHEQMALFTWSSLAGGFFSGRFRRDNLDTFDDYFDKLCVQSYGSEENFQRLERAEELARDKEMTLPQIALAYVLNQPLNIFALVGGATKDEVTANVQAAELTLSPEELDWLDLKRDGR